MRNNNWFSISGLGSAAHTPETLKKWHSFPGDKSKSDYGRLAVLKYAKDLGFEYSEKEVDHGMISEAYNYLIREVFKLSPDVSGKKSSILRTAIIHYS